MALKHRRVVVDQPVQKLKNELDVRVIVLFCVCTAGDPQAYPQKEFHHGYFGAHRKRRRCSALHVEEEVTFRPLRVER